jgi:hypothetical protein
MATRGLVGDAGSCSCTVILSVADDGDDDSLTDSLRFLRLRQT